MPEPLDQPEPSNPSDPTPEPAAAPPPEYVRVEDFRRLEQIIAGQSEMMQALGGSVQQALRSVAAPARPVEPNAELTDEQIDTMVDEGRMTRSQAARLIAKREIAELTRTRIDPLQNDGLNAIGATVKAVAMPQMPYYAKYKAEIDKMLDGLPPNAKISAENYIAAHNLVVGQHSAELIEEAREAAIRSATQPKPEVVAPTSRTGRSTRTDQVPTVEELMGRDAANALESKGLTPDSFAKRLGYPGWKEYAALAEKQATGAV